MKKSVGVPTIFPGSGLAGLITGLLLALVRYNDGCVGLGAALIITLSCALILLPGTAGLSVILERNKKRPESQDSPEHRR